MAWPISQAEKHLLTLLTGACCRFLLEAEVSSVAARLQTSASPLMVRGLATLSISAQQLCCRLWLQGQLCRLPHMTKLASSLTSMLHGIDAELGFRSLVSMLHSTDAKVKSQAGPQLGLKSCTALTQTCISWLGFSLI